PLLYQGKVPRRYAFNKVSLFRLLPMAKTPSSSAESGEGKSLLSLCKKNEFIAEVFILGIN
ncbi:MAG TPA: hypothetical protein VJ279_10510, partial [Hanamia sp.]|nr:hypothetical protein [Hanamia sp.]